MSQPTCEPALVGIRIYPVKGEPGQPLQVAQVTTAGVTGDRPKKSPVHLVSTQDCDDADPRANLVVDLTRDAVAELLGHSVRIGEVELVVTKLPSHCPGVYADVTAPGTVRVGDPVVSGPVVSGSDGTVRLGDPVLSDPVLSDPA